MGVALREDQAATSIVLFLDVLLGADFRIIDRLARMLPAFDAVAHDADIDVSGFNRPTGGFMRSVSMQVGAVENEFGAFLGGQFFRDVVFVVAGQEMRVGNNAGARAQGPSVRIVNVNVRVRIGDH